MFIKNIENLNKLSKEKLIEFVVLYDDYIYNDGEEWDKNRQPVGVSEYLDNEYQELKGE